MSEGVDTHRHTQAQLAHVGNMSSVRDNFYFQTLYKRAFGVSQWFQWYTNIVQGFTNGTIGNNICTNGNANGTIGSPNGTIGTIGKPIVPLATNGTIGEITNGTLGESRTEP